MKHQSCAACKFHRRTCPQDCILAPYFPPNMPNQFYYAQRLFGAARIAKSLKTLPLHSRSTAAATMCTEADLRFKDPAGGCYKIITSLVSYIKQFEDELLRVRSQLHILRCGGTVNVMPQHFGDFRYNAVLGLHYGSNLLQLQSNVNQEHRNGVQELAPQPHQGDGKVFDLSGEGWLEEDVTVQNGKPYQEQNKRFAHLTAIDGDMPEENAIPVQNLEEEERDVKEDEHEWDPQLPQFKNNIVQEQSYVADEVPRPHQEERNAFDLRDEVVQEQDVTAKEDEEWRDVRVLPLHGSNQL